MANLDKIQTAILINIKVSFFYLKKTSMTHKAGRVVTQRPPATEKHCFIAFILIDAICSFG